jgi:hypothetical protein
MHIRSLQLMNQEISEGGMAATPSRANSILKLKVRTKTLKDSDLRSLSFCDLLFLVFSHAGNGLFSRFG